MNPPRGEKYPIRPKKMMASFKAVFHNFSFKTFKKPFHFFEKASSKRSVFFLIFLRTSSFFCSGASSFVFQFFSLV